MDVKQMVAVVTAYIHHRTGKEVQINMHNLNVMLLITAYNHATEWFQNNNGTVVLI